MKLIERIENSVLLVRAKEFLDTIKLPGMDGLSVFKVGAFFIEGVRKGYVTTRAYSLAFRFFLALFPSVIFLFTLIPFIPVDNFQDEVLKALATVLPASSYDLALEAINDIINTPRGGLLSVGFILAIYFASNGINAMIDAFNRSYHVIKKGNFWKQRLNSLILLFILTVLVIMAIGLLMFGSQLVAYIGDELGVNGSWLEHFVVGIEIIIILFLYFLGFSFIYYFGNVRSSKFRFISAGSTLATLMSLLLTYGFSYYVNNFASYNKIYGSIGALIVILLWIYLNSLVLLIGFELNASIGHARHVRANEMEDEV